jgi:hypothetical protein
VATYSGPAVIRQGDVAVRVNCDLESWDEDAGLPGLRGVGQLEGSFESYEPLAIEPGLAVIELGDGRTGEVIVSLQTRHGRAWGTLTGSSTSI